MIINRPGKDFLRWSPFVIFVIFTFRDDIYERDVIPRRINGKIWNRWQGVYMMLVNYIWTMALRSSSA
jgi:hypothetical protein